MALVKGYVLASALSAMVAFFSIGSAPPLVLALYCVGAVLFALAAIGQFMKEQKQRK